MQSDFDSSEKPGAAEDERANEAAHEGDPDEAKNAGEVRLWSDRARSGEEHCRLFAMESKVEMAFYLGYHYLEPVSASDLRRGNYKLVPCLKKHDHRVELTVNLYQLHIDSSASRMLLDRPIPVAVAGTQTEENWLSAAVGNQFLRHREKEWEAQKNYNRLAVCVAATGLAWIFDSFDPTGSAEFKGEKGQPVKGPIGNIKTELGSPWEVYWEPDPCVSDSSLYVRKRWMRLKDVRKYWPDRGKYVTATTDTESLEDDELGDLLDDHILGNIGNESPVMGSSDRDLDEPGGEMVLVQEGYEKVAEGGADDLWKIFQWAGKVKLSDETVGWQPATPFVFKETLGHDFPIGVGKSLRPIQKRVNRDNSLIEENIEENARPKVLLHTKTNLKPGSMGSKPGEHVEYSGHEPPSYLEPPKLDSDVKENILRNEAYMKDLAKNHDASQGIAPSSSSSGIMVNLLQNQDMAGSMVPRENFHAGLRTHFRNEIAIAKHNFNEKHWIDLSGEGEEDADLEEFLGDDLSGVRDVTLEVVSGIPLMPNEERALTLELATMGFYDDDREEARNKLREDLNLGATKRTLSIEEAMKALCRREQILLEKTGTMPSPSKDELSDICYEQHLLFKFSKRYQKLNPAQKKIFETHLYLTEFNMVRRQAEATGRDLFAQNAGLPPPPDMAPAGSEAQGSNQPTGGQ